MNRTAKYRAWDKKNGNMLFDVSTGTITIWSHPDGRSAESKDCDFIVELSLLMGKGVHVGRVNSQKRLRMFMNLKIQRLQEV